MNDGLMKSIEPGSSGGDTSAKGLLSSAGRAFVSAGKTVASGAMEMVQGGLDAFAGAMKVRMSNGSSSSGLKAVDSVLSNARTEGLDAIMGPRFEQQAFQGAKEIFGRGVRGKERARSRDAHELGE